jgi:hypothetical protein
MFNFGKSHDWNLEGRLNQREETVVEAMLEPEPK